MTFIQPPASNDDQQRSSSDLEAASFPSRLDWSEQGSAASLRTLFEDADSKARQAIDWYLRDKRPKSRWSRSLRGVAIVLTTGGGLTPLLAGSGLLQGTSVASSIPIPLSQLGYVLLALAAATVLVDRYFGFSSAWMRYMTAAMRLKAARTSFQYEWTVMEARLRGGNPTVDQTEAMLLKINDFVRLLHAEIENETREWIVEFRSGLSELEKAARTQQEQLKPGAIDLTVPNAIQVAPAGFDVYVDGTKMATVVGTSWQMAHVPPGIHRVGVSANVSGKWLDASGIADVPAGSVAKVSLPLPATTQVP
jgi:hypothetical protein